jgi:hypothetical protein
MLPLMISPVRPVMNRVLRIAFIAAATVAGTFLLGGAPSAEAGGRTSVSIGVGFGYYGGYGGGYYGRPYYPYYYRPYYYPPAYYYAPPPVVYAPPPVVYSAPPVVVTQPPPMQATGTSPSYTAQNGQTCREFQSTATIGGQQQPVYGTACLQSDGAWRVVR